MSPTITSVSAATAAPCPRLESGYCVRAAAPRSQVGERRLDRHAVLQPPDAIEPVAAAPLVALAVGVIRHPEFRGLGGREMKLARQDADDGRRHAIEDHRLAEDVDASGVALLPRRVAQERRVRRGREVLADVEITSERRRHPERPKEPIADTRDANRLWPAGRREGEAVALINVQRLERCVARLPVEVVGIGQIALRKNLDALEHADETRGIRIRQRFEQRGIHECENRDAGAQAEREDHDGGRGEPRILPKLADREAKVLRQVLEDRHALLDGQTGTMDVDVSRESTASSTGVMWRSCLARMTRFQRRSNFFHPAA